MEDRSEDITETSETWSQIMNIVDKNVAIKVINYTCDNTIFEFCQLVFEPIVWDQTYETDQ